LKDSEKVEKLKQSLPPSMCSRSCFGSFANPYLNIFKPIFPQNRAIGIEVICDILPDYLLTASFTDLTIADTPKKNAKGKRVAQ
jgi:hypothetical protein